MKTWLLALLVSSQIALIELLPSDIKIIDLNDPGAIVKMFNSERREEAKESNYAAMWKLEWSDELLQKIKSLPKDCNSLTPASGYRFELMSADDQTAEWARREAEYLFYHNRDVLQRSTAFIQESLETGQKQVACAEYICTNRKSVDPRVKETANFNTICLYGPNQEFTFTNKGGSPGSGCELEGGEDEDGLCVPSESSGSSTLFNFSIMASLVLLVSVIFD